MDKKLLRHYWTRCKKGNQFYQFGQFLAVFLTGVEIHRLHCEASGRALRAISRATLISWR
ncbi:MAG: hypothetical protein ACI91G_001462, partial [Gammaproteobacteria bacterium]